MKQARILIVEDEFIARENLEHILQKEGYEILALESGVEALKELEKHEFDLVMTDLRMQQVDGMQVLERTRELYPDTEVIMITGYATVSTAVEAMQKGAYHYLAKPYKIDEVRILVRQALERRWLKQEVSELRQQVRSQKGIPLLIGKTAAMEGLKNLITQIAPTDCTVLILGETGTGKELVAKAIHHLSTRSDRRFLAINCGSFTEELLAHELFGHEKEAFTGARGVKKGLLEVATEGTVFLDEIAEMSLSMQAKLLRVLQDRTFFRVGGTTEIPVDIRILAATNKELKQEVDRGTFRQDLYYRLNVITVEVPSLSERKDDIPLLSQHFLEKYSQLQGKQVEKISPEVMDILMNYAFPGNVRELENIIERGVTLASGSAMEVQHLPADLREQRFDIQRRPKTELLTLEENEKEYIDWVLSQVKGNKTRAAEILGIDRVSLWRKLKRYGMEA
ncbi:MAG: sigma-54-dependent transcriptional regulator [Thermodesulfobacteriota bacterium]